MKTDHQYPLHNMGFSLANSTAARSLQQSNKINTTHQNDVIYVEFCKAFDSVPHS